MPVKRIFLLIDLFLIALTVFLCVHWTYSLFSLQMDTLPRQVASERTVSTRKPSGTPSFSDYSSIAKRNLFQTHSASENDSTPNVEALPKTELDLKLWGTVAGDTENSFAYIEDTKEKKQKLFKIGDMIQENVKLSMIMKDRVVLSVSGKEENLLLQERSAGSTATASRSSSSSASRTTSSSSTRRSTVSISLSRSQVNNALENLTELAGQINIQPYSEDGTEGLKLSSIKPNSIFRRMGLRNGDVLTAVDGSQLTSVDQAYKLYEDLKSSDTASVDILRNGRERTYQYRIR